MSVQQKNIKKVVFAANGESNSQQIVVQFLEEIFKNHQVVITKEFASASEISSDDANEEFIPIKSYKSFRKATDCVLTGVQKLLTKQLSDSLDVIVNEVFSSEEDEESSENGVKSLLIFLGLLKIEAINELNSNKILKWIFDLSSMSSMPLPMQLGNMIASIKKKLIKLGFIVLKKIRQNEYTQIFDYEDEQQFKVAVSHLIKSKQDKINQLQYQLCRVCEAFIPMNCISAHLNQCQHRHQKQYYQSKIQEKGKQLLNQINQLNPSTETRYYLKVFFDRLYESMGELWVKFTLRNCQKQIKYIIDQYKEDQTNQIFSEIVELLVSYNQILLQDSFFGQNQSDKDSKAMIKSKNNIGGGRITSYTSLLPSSHQTEFAIMSEKTINSDSEAISRCNSCRLSDFQVLQKIGQGSYSQVYLVRKKNTKDLYAMKVIQIQHLKQDRIDAFKKQQKIYKSISGGYNVKLYYSFSQDNLYFFILDFGCGGNFRTLLQKQVYFAEQYAKVYAANLILAVDSIHRMGIVHRDLKPQNIVINQLGQLILTDFNLSKLIKDNDNEKPNTFFGTPDYIAPQVLRGQPTNQTIDWFSVGAIIYQMVIGVTPFADQSSQAVFENILKGQIDWPEIGNEEGQITVACKDLIEGLLNSQPSRRLGFKGLEQIQNHKFFEGINWGKLQQNQYFYVPEKVKYYQQNVSILQYIESKKHKSSIKFIPGDTIVRYDILKSITNKHVKSHRNSRFKLQKQLQALKILPSFQSVKLKKHSSYNNFNNTFQQIGISCKDFFDQNQHKQQNN